ELVGTDETIAIPDTSLGKIEGLYHPVAIEQMALVSPAQVEATGAITIQGPHKLRRKCALYFGKVIVFVHHGAGQARQWRHRVDTCDLHKEPLWISGARYMADCAIRRL